MRTIRQVLGATGTSGVRFHAVVGAGIVLHGNFSGLIALLKTAMPIASSTNSETGLDTKVLYVQLKCFSNDYRIEIFNYLTLNASAITG